MSSKEQHVRERILYGRNENPDLSIRDVAKKLKLPKSTVHEVLKTFSERLSVQRKPRNDKNVRRADRGLDRKVKQVLERNPNLSVREVARKIGKSAGFVQNSKKRSGLKSYKVKKVPNRSDKQNLTAKTRARKLYTEYLTKFSCVVMDDETYVVEDFKQLPGLAFYTAMAKNAVAEHFKTKKLSKFPKKHLVWQAICTCGKKSRAFITTGTINKEIYQKECLEKRLLPFIRSHTDNPLFWPDLASCHYAKTVMKWYEDNNVNIVPKTANPPNCPELRPIERYWALIKRELSGKKTDVKNAKHFHQIWTKAAKSITEEGVQVLMDGVKRKVREFYVNTK
jgi:transposase